LTDYLIPILLPLIAWWLCTGVILFLNQLPPSTHKWSLLGTTLLFAGGLVTLDMVAQDATRSGAILAFMQALAIWSWLEMTYLTGALTGASREPCPPDAAGWNRFKLAVKTSIHHEIAVVLVGILIISYTWNAPNHFCALAYLTLWLMRWSAKLNLFFGVAKVNEEWFPPHMRYLASYIRTRRMNRLFPVSIALASLVAAWWIHNAAVAEDAHERTGYLLVTSLLCLAILEHGFMVSRIRDSLLWNWAMKAAVRCSTNVAK
jgi:putative photosynthetic complex assembly protein 2